MMQSPTQRRLKLAALVLLVIDLFLLAVLLFDRRGPEAAAGRAVRQLNADQLYVTPVRPASQN